MNTPGVLRSVPAGKGGGPDHDILVGCRDGDRGAWRALHLPEGLDGAALRLPLRVDARGEWLWRQAVALGCSELLAFHRDAPYRGGRSGACLRIGAPLA